MSKDLTLDNLFRGELANTKSFGNLTLGENMKRVNKALATIQPLHRNFGKSQSDFQIRVLNIGSAASTQRALSDISAEVQRKQDALEENKYKIMLEQVETEKLYRDLEIEKDELEQAELEIKISQSKSRLSRGMIAYEGAMKAVLSLKQTYDNLIKKCENFTEADFQKAELKSHILRTLKQSLEDMRQSGGGIAKGEQAYLYSIGLNVTKVRKKLLTFLQVENDQEGYSNISAMKFIDEFSEELIPHAQESIKYRGLDTEYDESIGYTPNYNTEEEE